MDKLSYKISLFDSKHEPVFFGWFDSYTIKNIGGDILEVKCISDDNVFTYIYSPSIFVLEIIEKKGKIEIEKRIIRSLGYIC